MTADVVIQQLNLVPHPEGGWFREVYRAAEVIGAPALPPRYNGDRAFSTSIYFLLRGREFSGFHRIRSDEIWHFYAGTGIRIHVLGHSNGEANEIHLGIDLDAGERPQCVIPVGTVFAAELADPGDDSFGLVGCTVAPGFDFADFEMLDCSLLLRQYPRHSGLIERLTRVEGVP